MLVLNELKLNFWINENLSFLAVCNFMNAENPASNSKHSLFDHFKRNLDLECNIPKFDINTGILTSKG